jgi:probable F420-dependent oxidoreductase
MDDSFRFIAPVPRLRGDGATWVSDVRRLETLGFDTVAVSEHFTGGWQLATVTAMAFAAACTSRLRVLSLVAQAGIHHPALLAKDIATIDRLSDGRAELGIGAGWLGDDYTALGLTPEPAPARFARLAEALEIIRRFFAMDSVNFAGDYYRINDMEALPQSVQRPRPPILVGAAGPRMLELAGQTADIVGIFARMSGQKAERAISAELTAASIKRKVHLVRAAAAATGRPAPRLQFTCYHVRVTDMPGDSQPSKWGYPIDAEDDMFKGSPAVLVGTAKECAAKLLEWRDKFGITYWHFGPQVDAGGRIIEQLDSR